MKKILFSALMGAMMISCNRDNDNTNPTTPQTPNQSIILPKKLTYSKPSQPDIVSTFNYNGDKLKEILLSVGDKTEITYTGDLITSAKGMGGEIFVLRYTNGVLTSETRKELHPDETIKNQLDYVYSYNGSEVTAQVTEMEYTNTGTLLYRRAGVVTYTLDAQKRPTKIVEQKDTFDGTNDKIFEYTSTETLVYASHKNIFKDIKGMDKLYHSHLMQTELSEIYSINYSTSKKVETNVTILGGSRTSANRTNEFKFTYTTNANNYPVKQQESQKDSSTGGVFVDDEGYTTIEY